MDTATIGDDFDAVMQRVLHRTCLWRVSFPIEGSDLCHG